MIWRGLGGLAAAAWMWAATPAVAAPVEAYGLLPAMQSVAIAPDGQSIAFITTAGEQRQVVVKSLKGESLATVALGPRKARSVEWADANHLLIVVSSTAAVTDVSYVGEQFQALSLNIRTGAYIQLPSKALDTVVNVVQGRLQPGMIGGEPFVITPLYVTVASNMQYKNGHLDLYRIDLETGVANRQQMGDSKTYDYLARPDGVAVAKVSHDDDQRTGVSHWTLSVKRGAGWQTVYETREAVDSPDLHGLSADGGSAIIETWDAAAAMWRPTSVSLEDGKVGDFIGPARPLYPLVGADGVVLGYGQIDTFLEYEFLDPRLKAVWPKARAAFKGRQVRLESWTPDYAKLVVHVDGGDDTGSYYLIDMALKRADLLGSAYPRVPRPEVAEVRPIRYAAADGLSIEAYLTLPRGRPEHALPLVVFPHGGPRTRDTMGFDWWAQAVASRGYAVLQPNFRGSAGYDTAFQNAGYGEWGAKMQTDLSDGVAHLAAQGLIDPKRVCIMGASYGGYAALAGVTLQKGIYRCAVSVAGVADLGKMMRDDTLKYGARSIRVRDQNRLFGVTSLGDPKLAERSPLRQAAKLDAPLLLVHGKDDTVVPYDHSNDMAKAARAAGKPVEFVTLNGEDHWLSSGATRLQMLTAVAAFLEKNNPPD